MVCIIAVYTVKYGVYYSCIYSRNPNQDYGRNFIIKTVELLERMKYMLAPDLLYLHLGLEPGVSKKEDNVGNYHIFERRKVT